MSKKIVSLSKNQDFKTLLEGKKFSNKYVTVFFKELINKSKNKLYISFVAKKKLGNAVKRNKIKRRLKNIMNDTIKKFSFNMRYSYLVIAKETVLKDEYENIRKTFLADFKKIK
tara:strand:+ start:214 stop:555 length:342 start_codon:yes stop_codon:yes gene_type:complete